MAPQVVAAQLYTLRDFTKTPADIARTLGRVRKMGYTSVQLSALGPIDPAELAKMLRDNGLTCCATHCSPDRLRTEPEKIIDEHRLWDCSLTAIGGYWPKDPTAEMWVHFMRDYSIIAQKLKAGGLQLGYHNHSHEMVRYGGRPAFDLLIENASPAVWFEIDTYWITHGGGDPIEWIGKVGGRIPAIHLKDMAMGADGKQIMAEVGEGNLNFPGIIRAATAAGTRYFIVEQDVCYRDPFDSLEISLKHLAEMGLT